MNALLLTLAVLVIADAKESVSGTVKDQAGQPLEGVLVLAQVGYNQQATTASTKTNSSGEFELGGIPDDAQQSQVQYFALKHGWEANYKRVLLNEKRPQPLEFVLRPAKTRSITIVDPTGQPVPGAEVDELSLIRDPRTAGHLFAPSLREFPLRSDATGNIYIDFLPSDHYPAIHVRTGTWGRQRDLFKNDDPDWTFRLRPVGSIEGRLVAPKGKAVSGISLDVEVRLTENQSFFSRASVKTDSEGKFRVPAIAAGQATIRVSHEQDNPVAGGPPVQVHVAAGETAVAELKLPRTLRVTGKVLAEKTDEPIAGAKVRAWNNAASTSAPPAVTDNDGVYSLDIVPGQIGVEVQDVPLPYYIGVRNTAGDSVNEGKESLEMPPLLVPRGRRIEGTVVDEQGRPAAQAWVTAAWWEEQNRMMTTGNRAIQSDESGRFVIEPVSSKVEVYLRGDTPDRAGTEFFTAPLGQNEPVRLSISPAGVAVLSGGVIDSQGKPIQGAAVRLHAGYRNTSNRLHFGGQQREWNLTTDADGKFQLPEALPRHLPNPGRLASFNSDQGYFLTITAPGRLQHQQQAKIGPEGSPFILPDIVLAREGHLTGRVLDRQGKPIAGVEVSAVGADPDNRGLAQHRSAVATTAADGRFELKKIHPDALFVFAAHKDYAFTGALLPSQEGELTFTLATREEAASEPPLTPRLTTPDENLAALNKLLLPVWDKLDPKEHAYQRAEIWKSLAPLDAEWARQNIPALYGLRYRIEAMQKLGHLDDAVELVAGLTGAYERGYTLVRLAGDIKDFGQKRQLLAEAVVQAKTIIDPTHRLSVLAQAAEALYDVGDREAAKKIIEENLPDIEKLEPGFWRGYLAETVALFDVDKALKLCEGATDKFERDRHPGNIAHELAATDPERAEAIIASVSAENQYRYIPAVCYRMAPVDLPRARKIADAAHKAHHDQRPYAYIVIAEAIYDQNPAEARKLLQESSELLSKMNAASIYDRQPFGVALALVHASERIDPAATRAYFWRAVSLARGVQFHTTRESELDSQFASDAELAILLKRYDQHLEIAARLVNPIYTCHKLPLQRLYQHVATIGMAVVDLDRAIDWVERYRAAMKPEQLRYIPQPWELMAAAVSGDEEAFWKVLHKKVFHLWLPDEEDGL